MTIAPSQSHCNALRDGNPAMPQGNRIWNLLDRPVRRLPGSGRIDSTTLWLVTTRGRRWTVSQPALRAWTIRGRATPVGTICLRC